MNVLRRFWDEHPRLSMWIIMAVGMVIIMVIAARHVGFTPPQWAWLIAATIGLAGLCTWIITWGDQLEKEAEVEPEVEEAEEESKE